MLQQGAPLLPAQVVDSLSMLAATSLQQRGADQGLHPNVVAKIGTTSALDKPTGAPPLSTPIIATGSAWRPWVAPSVRNDNPSRASPGTSSRGAARRHDGTTPSDDANGRLVSAGNPAVTTHLHALSALREKAREEHPDRHLMRHLGLAAAAAQATVH
jgi:hypothetical protein